jgi:hypothetical protein
MDAAHYWNQFPVDWRPAEPGEILIGTVEKLGQRRSFDGDLVASVLVKTDTGEMVNLIATHVHLLNALKDLKPRVGDRIKVLFEGQDARSAPGFRPANRYQVAVRDGVTGEKR